MKYNKNKEKLFAILPFVKDEYIWEEKKKTKRLGTRKENFNPKQFISFSKTGLKI